MSTIYMATKTIQKKISTKNQESSPDSPIEKRTFTEKAEVMLWALSGGHCEFCNNYLLEDWLTLSKGKYGQNAHIVAFKEDGPRGNVSNRPEKINDVNNLMLLCYEHHHLIDTEKPLEYPRERLEEMKRVHEERIKRLTTIKPENQTTVIRFQAKIGGDSVEISESDIKLALEPYYFLKENQVNINLTELDNNDDGYIDSARSVIKRKTSKLFDSQIDSNPIDHISVFAFAEIPLLVYLGASISNKITVNFYQKHGDTKDWKWKTDGEISLYDFKSLRKGTSKDNVALIISISGRISPSDLPNEIDESFSIYEITSKNKPLSPMSLRRKEDLEEFSKTYQIALRKIKENHSENSVIHLFPAVRPPIAVLCGHELRHKVDPELWVYDNNKRKDNKGFNLILKVNEYDR